MGLFSRFLFVVAKPMEFACAPASAHRPAANTSRFRTRHDDGPGLNSARGGGAMLDAAARDQS